MPEPVVNTGNSDLGNDKGNENKDDKKSNKVKIGDREYDPKQAESAISLYEALQDESTGKEIIETLARRAGLLDRHGDIKKKDGESTKTAESRAAKLIKSKLGKDYEKFADSLGPALDELIEETLTERFGQQEQANTKTSWDKSIDIFNDNYVLTPEIEESMMEFIEDSPPNFNRKTFDAQKYLGRMYKAACEELGVEAKPKRSARSKSRDSDEELPDFVVRDAPKNVTIDDAIEAAMKGIRFKRG